MAQPVFAYGIVILPPPALRREIGELRRRHPLLQASVPPHITVKSPFLYRGTGAWIAEILERVCARHQPFPVALRGVGAFGTEVLYVKVEENPALRALHQDLLDELTGYAETLNERYEGAHYVPHLTVADRLQPDDFAAARQVLNGWFPRSRWQADAIHLLRGKGRWDITRSFPLGEDPGCAAR